MRGEEGKASKREHKSIQKWQTAANVFQFTGIFFTVGAFFMTLFPATRVVSQTAQLVPGIVIIAQGAFQGYIGDRKHLASDTTYGEDKHSLANERAAILVQLDPFIEEASNAKAEEF